MRGSCLSMRSHQAGSETRSTRLVCTMYVYTINLQGFTARAHAARHRGLLFYGVLHVCRAESIINHSEASEAYSVIHVRAIQTVTQLPVWITDAVTVPAIRFTSASVVHPSTSLCTACQSIVHETESIDEEQFI